jgi:hypothetical protein
MVMPGEEQHFAIGWAATTSPSRLGLLPSRHLQQLEQIADLREARKKWRNLRRINDSMDVILNTLDACAAASTPPPAAGSAHAARGTISSGKGQVSTAPTPLWLT